MPLAVAVHLAAAEGMVKIIAPRAAVIPVAGHLLVEGAPAQLVIPRELLLPQVPQQGYHPMTMIICHWVCFRQRVPPVVVVAQIHLVSQHQAQMACQELVVA